MKKVLSLFVVMTMMLCAMSVVAFAQAATIIDGPTTIYPDSTPNPYGATIYDSEGHILYDPSTANQAYSGPVSVTKNPTGETVERGGKATFVAHAAGATSVTWRLVSSDGQEVIYAAAAPDYFSGLGVWGASTDSLTLSNIPDNLNGWLAEAMFTGEGGPVFSWGARITVKGSSANGTTTDLDPTGRLVAGVTGSGSSPVISEQPKGAELTSGKSTTLSVTAGTNDGGKLCYQWYVSASDDNTKGQAIAGATSASYTPGEIQGTRYYYAGVWSERDGVKSDTVYSNTAAVTYTSVTASPAPGSTATGNSPTPASTANANGANGNTGVSSNNNGTVDAQNDPTIVPAPEEQQTGTEGSAPSPSPTVAEPIRSSSESGSSLPVVLGAIAAVALAAGVGLLVLRRNSGS